MRFTRLPVLSKVTLLVAFGSCVSSHALDAEDKAWLERSREIIRSMDGKPPPEWLKGADKSGAKPSPSVVIPKGPPGAPVRSLSLDAIQSARAPLPSWVNPSNGGSAKPSNDSRERRSIFVSFSMPEAELIAAMEEAAIHDGVVILRGLAKGESVTQAGQRLRALAVKLERIPEVQIDPFAFRRENIASVPTISITVGDARLSATGSLALGALVERFAKGERGDLGRRGAMYAIQERDMMEDIQARIAAVDWKAQREGAYARYWSNREAINLPVATLDKLRMFDPSVEVKSDIHAANGQLVARAGQRVNPQAMMPLQSVWFVFDPRDPHQLSRIDREIQQLQRDRTPYLLMATQLNTGSEWEHLRVIEDRFGLPVSIVTSELIQRFGIDRVPVRIRGSGHRLAITELGVNRQ
jgi:conjugal transfer pilus assembly protein TraW